MTKIHIYDDWEEPLNVTISYNQLIIEWNDNKDKVHFTILEIENKEYPIEMRDIYGKVIDYDWSSRYDTLDVLASYTDYYLTNIKTNKFRNVILEWLDKNHDVNDKMIMNLLQE